MGMDDGMEIEIVPGWRPEENRGLEMFVTENLRCWNAPRMREVSGEQMYLEARS